MTLTLVALGVNSLFLGRLQLLHADHTVLLRDLKENIKSLQNEFDKVLVRVK